MVSVVNGVMHLKEQQGIKLLMNKQPGFKIRMEENTGPKMHILGFEGM